MFMYEERNSKNIPKELYDQIYIELKKNRIYDVKKLTRINIKRILRKLYKERYYEHVVYIARIINGLPIPILYF